MRVNVAVAIEVVEIEDELHFDAHIAGVGLEDDGDELDEVEVVVLVLVGEGEEPFADDAREVGVLEEGDFGDALEGAGGLGGERLVVGVPCRRALGRGCMRCF